MDGCLETVHSSPKCALKMFHSTVHFWVNPDRPRNQRISLLPVWSVWLWLHDARLIFLRHELITWLDKIREDFLLFHQSYSYCYLNDWFYSLVESWSQNVAGFLIKLERWQISCWITWLSLQDANFTKANITVTLPVFIIKTESFCLIMFSFFALSQKLLKSI